MFISTLRLASITGLVAACLLLSPSFAETTSPAIAAPSSAISTPASAMTAPAAPAATVPAAAAPVPAAVTSAASAPGLEQADTTPRPNVPTQSATPVVPTQSTPSPSDVSVTPTPNAPVQSAAPAAPTSSEPIQSTSTVAPAPDAASAKPEASAQQEEKDPADRKLVGRVVWVKGNFEASAPGSADKRVLKTSSHIFMNDTLTTASNSEAQIVFTDNSTMTFRPGTNFYINEYNYNPKTGKDGKKSTGKYVMDLIKGGFRTVTGLVAKNNPNDYQVNTPVATIGVRGTEFSVVIAKNGELFVKRFKGEPCVANKEKGRSNEMCLDQKKRYAQVASAGADPVALTKEPDVFNVDVEIVPVTFTNTDTNIGGSGGSGFCIQ